MSKRRQVGEEFWLSPGSAFLGTSNRYKVRIPHDPELNDLALDGRPYGSCHYQCGDPECCEWDNLEIVQAPEGREADVGEFLFHVCECEMHDEPQTERVLQ